VTEETDSKAVERKQQTPLKKEKAQKRRVQQNQSGKQPSAN
jgi:hypothetical protein